MSSDATGLGKFSYLIMAFCILAILAVSLTTILVKNKTGDFLIVINDNRLVDDYKGNSTTTATTPDKPTTTPVPPVILPGCVFSDDSCPRLTPKCPFPSNDFLLNGREAEGNSPRVDLSLPSWINFPLLLKGQEVMKENWFSFGLSAALGRAVNMNIPDIRDAAMYVGAMSVSPVGAAKVLASFAAKTMTWAEDKIGLIPESAQASDFLESVNRIRWIHIKVQRDLEREMRRNRYVVPPEQYENVTVEDAIWDAFSEDLRNSDIPANQRFVPVTQWTNQTVLFFNQQSISLFQYNAFSHLLMMPDTFGANLTELDVWALNHLSAVIAYTFGVDDEFNIALQPDSESMKQYYREIFEGVVIPSFFHLDKKTKVTVENVMKGTRLNTPAWTLQLYLYRVATMLLEIQAPRIFGLLNEDDLWHQNNLENNVLPQLKSNKTFRDETNAKSLSDLVSIGEKYYGPNYRTQYGRARHSFNYPIENACN